MADNKQPQAPSVNHSFGARSCCAHRFESASETNFVFSSAEFAAQDFMLPVVQQLYDKGAFDEGTKLRFVLALQEAFANSLEHGNLELRSTWKEEIDAAGLDKFTIMKRERLTDPHYANRRIWIESSLNDAEVRITVRDEGLGFKVPAAVVRASEVDPKAYGRGLAIMMAVMDEVHYAENGTRITLLKRL